MARRGLDNPYGSTARIIDPGSAGGPRRASNLPQCREWLFAFCAPGRADDAALRAVRTERVLEELVLPDPGPQPLSTTCPTSSVGREHP